MLHRHHSEPVEVELIRSLFDALVPSLIMSIGFMLCGGLIVAKTGDAILSLLLVCGALASVARLVVAWIMTSDARRADLSLDEARQLERRFALPYYGFAILLGLFGFRAFLLPASEVHMLMICMIIGYCAGVTAGMGLRPRIAVPSMVLSIVPAILAGLFQGDIIHVATALMSAAFLSGGIYSLRRRHDRAVQDIGLRLVFANLARKDALTTLPNRIALREWYDERIARDARHGLIAVHYIDLNGFKPINDTYGHPVGDALLTAVGKRIAGTIRNVDMAARLGGDEFAVIQHGIDDAEAARKLAMRLSAAIARPFQIENHTIRISTGLGYVIVEEREQDLDHLLGLADRALYASKRKDGAVVRYEAPKSEDQRTAA